MRHVSSSFEKHVRLVTTIIKSSMPRIYTMLITLYYFSTVKIIHKAYVFIYNNTKVTQGFTAV